MRGLLDKMNEETTVTRKLENGTTVTIKSPKGAQTDMNGILGGQVNGPDHGPVADNVTAKLTPGEYVINRPAAQKYKGLLEQINNEGRMMLAEGGHIPGYAFGGQAEGYDNQRRIRKWLETVKPGSRDEEILLDRLGIKNPKAYYTEENPDMGYGYATDDDPIISQGNPAQWAAEWAGQNGVDFTDYNLEKLEMLCKEAIADFGRIPQHEKDEWGSERELAWYYMDEFAVEEGVEKGYANGGMVGAGMSPEGASMAPGAPVSASPAPEGMDVPVEPTLSPEGSVKSILLGTPEFVERISAAAQQGRSFADVLSTLFNEGRVKELAASPEAAETVVETAREIFEGGAQPQQLWSGGEVEGQPSPGATPDEGDSITIKGQTVYYRGGQWVYNSGKAAPEYVITGIQEKIAPASSDTGGDAGGSEGNSVDIDKENHAKNYAWGKRAIEAEKVIRELIAGGFNPGSWEYAKGETLAKYLGDLARSAEGQRYKKAVESLVAAVLRKDTGAAIAADEFERTYRQLFGSLGTGEGAQQDAANQRARNIEGFIAASGPGAEELQKAWDEAQKTGAGAPEDPSTLSGEDVGGIAGGILGGVLGLFFGPAGAAALAAGGTYLGRALGQYLTDDEPSIIEALTPEMSDLIDTAIAPLGSGLGRAALAGFKAQVAKKALKDGVTDAGGIRNIARNIAEGGLVKGVAKSVAGDTVAEISEKYLSAGFKEVSTESGKYFGKFLPNGLFKAVNAQTGRAIAQNTTEHKAVKAAFQAARGAADDAAGAATTTFATGGEVKGGLLGYKTNKGKAKKGLLG